MYSSDNAFPQCIAGSQKIDLLEMMLLKPKILWTIHHVAYFSARTHSDDIKCIFTYGFLTFHIYEKIKSYSICIILYKDVL